MARSTHLKNHGYKSMTCNYRWMSDVRWSSGKQDWHYNKQVSLKTMAICDTKLAPLTCTQKSENQ